jgi:tetratricopeptide (TPR) repeat protein
MHMMIRMVCVVIALALLVPWQQSSAKQNNSVIGPSNINLADGADELLAGNAEEGVRLSLRGMPFANNKKDRLIGMSNLCAGYFMLGQMEEALSYCDQALEIDESHWRALSNRALIYVELKRYDEAEQDLQRGLAIAPNARTLKIISGMLLDATDPVAPSVIIDDRRNTKQDDYE